MSTPVSELRGLVAESRAKCADAGEFRGAFRFGVAQDIIADDVRVHEEIVREAYAAEQEDSEAERLLSAAQSHDSDGGENITPQEAAPIHRLIQRSRKRDHTITEIAEAK
jgi:hypothetical protein